MSDLDFSELTDDQLVGLLRSILQEAVKRHPGVQEAAKAAVLDESEKAKIRVDAANREAAAMRARERELIAAEAAAKVRAEAAAANSAAEAERERSIREAQAAEARIKAQAARLKAAEDAERAVRSLEARETKARDFLLRASALVDLPPGNICLVGYGDVEGRGIFINQGSDRYSRDHLVEVRSKRNEGYAWNITTRRHLMSRKSDLLRFLIEFFQEWPDNHIRGSDYFPAIQSSEANA